MRADVGPSLSPFRSHGASRFLPPQKMRSLITQAFKDKQNTADVTVINRLIVQGRMDLEEALMLWKGPSHVRARTPAPPARNAHDSSSAARAQRTTAHHYPAAHR